MADALVERMLASRERWVQLTDALSVRLRRPSELDLLKISSNNSVSIGLDMMIDQATGWKGFTERVLYPGGALDEVNFRRDVWKEWISDNNQHWSACVEALQQMIEARRAEAETAQKN